MKKTSLILLSTLCALAANAVVDIPGSTSSTGRPVVKDIADGQDIRLLPNAEAPTEASNISMAGATVKSIELAAKPTGGYTPFFTTLRIAPSITPHDELVLRKTGSFV